MNMPQGPRAARSLGIEALTSYENMLRHLAEGTAPAALPLIQQAPGVARLFQTMSAVAPAVPGAGDEEWNPLSQRPHAPLPPTVGDELGAEVTALKEAVDAFTTLIHEMMHVALWEPFFVGKWKPRQVADFREFSLRAEGFCFFYSDVVVSNAVRVRLADGEFALERQTPSNARFHPVRAFHAVGIRDHDEILSIYLEGFSGGRTKLWQPRGKAAFAASLAAQVYDFYVGSQGYLNGAYKALATFGTFAEFRRRFCAIPGLPGFLSEAAAEVPSGFTGYFERFFHEGLARLAALEPDETERIRWRRMLQMRAYYALQVRWALRAGLVVAQRFTDSRRARILEAVDAYLAELRSLLLRLARGEEDALRDALATCDAKYEEAVRRPLLAHEAWVGQRWLIAPRRAGGLVNVFDASAARGRPAKVELLQTVAFFVDELSRRVQSSKTVETRVAALAALQRISALGATGGTGSATQTRKVAEKLRRELRKAHLLSIWSVPLAAFDPAHNAYRELLFSYQ
jgi:hypothetical protein